MLLIALSCTIIGFKERFCNIKNWLIVSPINGVSLKDDDDIGNNTATCREVDIDDKQQSTVKNEKYLEPMTKKKSTILPSFKGGDCSRYGIKFIECITSTFNVKDILIDRRYNARMSFVEGKRLQDNIKQRKRFLLYW